MRAVWRAVRTATAAWITLLGLAPAVALGQPEPVLALRGATVVDGTGAAPIPDGVVVVEDGRIRCVGPVGSCAIPPGAREIDVTGRWITPGLIDAHVHVSQTGWVDGRPDALDLRDVHPYPEVAAGLRARPDRWHRSYLCSGITAVFDVGGFPWTWDLRAEAEDDPRSAHVAAAGPLVTHRPLEIVNLPGERQFVELADEQTGRELVRYLALSASDAVKVWFLAPSPEEREAIDARVLAVGEEARERGIPLIVHATTLREARVALEAGADLLVHSVGDSLVDDAFLARAKELGTVYTPTLTVFDGYFRTFRSLVTGEVPEIDDPGGCVDPATREKVRSTPGYADRAGRRFTEERLEAMRAGLDRTAEIQAENLRRVHAAGIPVATGSDAGNPLTLHGPSIYVEMEAMQAAGLAPMEVVVATTRDAARAMGRADDLGTLEAGKVADLLIVGSDPVEDVANLRRVERVVRAGVVHEVEDLAYP